MLRALTRVHCAPAQSTARMKLRTRGAGAYRLVGCGVRGLVGADAPDAATFAAGISHRHCRWGQPQGQEGWLLQVAVCLQAGANENIQVAARCSLSNHSIALPRRHTAGASCISHEPLIPLEQRPLGCLANRIYLSSTKLCLLAGPVAAPSAQQPHRCQSSRPWRCRCMHRCCTSGPGRMHWCSCRSAGGRSGC